MSMPTELSVIRSERHIGWFSSMSSSSSSNSSSCPSCKYRIFRFQDFPCSLSIPFAFFSQCIKLHNTRVPSCHRSKAARSRDRQAPYSAIRCRSVRDAHGAGRISRTILVPEALYPALQASPRDRRTLPDGDLRRAAFRPRAGYPAAQKSCSLRAAGLQHRDRASLLFAVSAGSLFRFCADFRRSGPRSTSSRNSPSCAII